ncbi:MAG TPA: AIR synthase-related protein, partial [Aquihabitans sp.]|nr:AIR synthase-related protein [Aquihabitans sp.]
LGMVDELTRRPPGVTLHEGDRLVLLGDDLAGPAPSLAGSQVAWAAGHRGGELPELDARAHTRLADLVRGLVAGGGLAGVHDASSGGLGVALAELSVRSGVGVDVAVLDGTTRLFAEQPSRVVAAVAPAGLADLLAAADAAGVPAVELGSAGGDRFRLGGPAEALVDVAVGDLTATWRDRLPDALGAGTTQA